MRPQPGELIQGKYRVVQLIADGGMGAIYEARHEVLGTAVALKLLHPDLARRQALVARFLQEARVSATLKSPHIVQVLDIIQEPQGAVLVMELLQGEPLQRLLDRQRRLPQTQAIDIALQMLSALEVAHAGGVVHRDLKPDNVFLVGSSADPQVKLLDFGIAKLRTTQEFQRGLTRPGVVMGTPEYMAPEQAFSADTVDARADIYALGVMLFEMLAGQRPVGGDEPRVIAQRVFAGQVRALSAIDSTIPMGLVAAVHRAMAPTPAGRFASAVEMGQALLPFAGPRRTPPFHGATTPPSAPSTLPQPSQAGVPSALNKGAPASVPGLPSMLAPPPASPTGPSAAPAGQDPPPSRGFSPGGTAPLAAPYSHATGAMAGWPQNAPTAPSAQPSLGPPGPSHYPSQGMAQHPAGPASHQGAGPMSQGQGPQGPGQAGSHGQQAAGPRPTSGVPRTLPPGSDEGSNINNTTMPRDPLPQAFTPSPPNPWSTPAPGHSAGPPPTVGGSDPNGIAPYAPPAPAPTGVYTSAGYSPPNNAGGPGYTSVGGPPAGGGGFTAIGQAPPQMTAVTAPYQGPGGGPSGYGAPPGNFDNYGAPGASYGAPAYGGGGRRARRGVPVGVVAALAGLAGGLLVVLVLVLRGQDSPSPAPVPITPTLPPPSTASAPPSTGTLPPSIPTLPVTTPLPTTPHTTPTAPRPTTHPPDGGLPGADAGTGADAGGGIPIPGINGLPTLPGVPSAIPTSITIPFPF